MRLLCSLIKGEFYEKEVQSADNNWNHSCCTYYFCDMLYAFSEEVQNEYAERTQYFSNGVFHAPEDFTVMTEYEGEPIEKSDEMMPSESLPIHKTDSLPETQSGEWNITWFGHSTFMLQVDGKKIFVDPVLSEYASPVQGAGPKRMAEVPIDTENLPEIDVLIISHDHYDHLDYNTICDIDSKVKQYIVPLGVEQHLMRWGIDESKIHTIAWWESFEAAGLRFTSTPGLHYTGRLPWQNNTSLWSGYVIKSSKHQIYYTGDTGYGEHFKEIYNRFGKMDLMIVENGQYDKAWSQTHMMPEEGVEAAKLMEADVILPVHWAGFSLAYHSWYEPIERFTASAKGNGVTVITPMIGDTFSNATVNEYMNEWWE